MWEMLPGEQVLSYESFGSISRVNRDVASGHVVVCLKPRELLIIIGDSLITLKW